MKKMLELIGLIIFSSTSFGSVSDSIDREFKRVSSSALVIVQDLRSNLNSIAPSASAFCYLASRLDSQLISLSQIEIPIDSNGNVYESYKKTDEFLSTYNQPIFGSACGIIPGVPGHLTDEKLRNSQNLVDLLTEVEGFLNSSVP